MSDGRNRREGVDKGERIQDEEFGRTFVSSVSVIFASDPPPVQCQLVSKAGEIFAGAGVGSRDRI